MHYGLVLVSFIFRCYDIFHDINIFYQLFNKNVILCVNNWSKLVLPPMLTSLSLLATLFHPSCDPDMIHSFLLLWSASASLSNENFDFCYLPSFCSAYATIRCLSCINKLDDIFNFYLRRMSCPSFCSFFFFVSF